MLLEIDGTRYPIVGIEDIELRHVAKLQRELANNPGITSLTGWNDIRRALGEWGNLPAKDREEHPESLFFTCLTIWAARVTAGEDVTLLEAVAVPVSQIHWIVEPSDRAAGEGEGKAKRPAASRGANRPAKPKPKTRASS